MAMFSSSRLAVLQRERRGDGDLSVCLLSRPQTVNEVRRRSHLPWKSRRSSRQALTETSGEAGCLFIMSTRLTWSPLDSSSGRISPAESSSNRHGDLDL